MSKRGLALILAVALAGLATIALVSYARGLEDKAFAGIETVEAYVAKEAIPAGTSGDFAIERALIRTDTIPRKVFAQGAITTLDQIRGKVAGTTIFPGEQILAARFVEPGAVEGVLPVPRDRVAMSVQVGIPPGVAGFIRPRDRISVIAQLKVLRGAREEQRTQFLIQNVEVLAVGERVINEEGQAGTASPAGNVLVTIAVTPSDAEKLTYAIFNGQLYFTLLPPGARAVRTAGRTISNAFQ